MRPLAAAATGSATLAPLVPLCGLTGFAAGGSQLEDVFGVVMRHLATPTGIRLVVIRKEVRALAVDPEVRVFAIRRETLLLAPRGAAEARGACGDPEHRRMTTFIKDPDAVLDYSVDWSKWLAGGQIQTSAWFVSDPALKAMGDSNTTTRTTVWLPI